MMIETMMTCLKIMIRCDKPKMDLVRKGGSQESMKQWEVFNQTMKIQMRIQMWTLISLVTTRLMSLRDAVVAV